MIHDMTSIPGKCCRRVSLNHVCAFPVLNSCRNWREPYCSWGHKATSVKVSSGLTWSFWIPQCCWQTLHTKIYRSSQMWNPSQQILGGSRILRNFPTTDPVTLLMFSRVKRLSQEESAHLTLLLDQEQAEKYLHGIHCLVACVKLIII